MIYRRDDVQLFNEPSLAKYETLHYANAHSRAQRSMNGTRIGHGHISPWPIDTGTQARFYSKKVRGAKAGLAFLFTLCHIGLKHDKLFNSRVG